METLCQVWSYISNHIVELLGLIIAYLSLVVPIRQYLGSKNLEEKDKRFNNYHRLIKELVSPDERGVAIIDRQIAVAFELRNYPEYYEVTRRILTGLKTFWTGQPNTERLIDEINITIEAIDETAN